MGLGSGTLPSSPGDPPTSGAAAQGGRARGPPGRGCREPVPGMDHAQERRPTHPFGSPWPAVRTCGVRAGANTCRLHGPRRRGCKQPGGSAVRTGARGSGYSVRAAGSGVVRLHSRTSTAPGSQHVVNTPQKQTFPSSFARPPRKLRIFTGCKASGIQPARCQNSQRGTRNSYCN